MSVPRPKPGLYIVPLIPKLYDEADNDQAATQVAAPWWAPNDVGRTIAEARRHLESRPDIHEEPRAIEPKPAVLVSKAQRPRGRFRRIALNCALVVAMIAAGGTTAYVVRTAPVTVAVTHARRVDMNDAVRSSGAGEIGARQRSTVRSTANGAHVFRALVKPGDRVRVGDVVARSEDAEVARSLANARGKVSSLEATLRETTAVADALPSEIDALRSRLGGARAEVASKEAEASRLVAVANLDGFVRAVHANDALTQTSAPLVEIADDSTMRARVPFAESDAPRITVGMNALIEVPGYNERFVGTIATIDAAVEQGPQGRSVWTEVELRHDDRLRLGNTAVASVPLATRKAVLTLEASAIDTTQGLSRVMVIEEGRVRAIPLALGTRDGDRIEIRGELREDATIIARPQDVRIGQRVRP